MTHFDRVLNVNHSGEVKYNPDLLNEIYGSEVLSFWMAETDFPAPPNIKEALKKVIEKDSYTYHYKTPTLRKSISDWFQNRHQLSIDPDALLFTSGVMTGIATAVDSCSEKGDGVIFQPPVYQEFKSTIQALDRQLVKNPLIEKDGFYKINFDDLEEKAKDPRNKILLICNPHNPVGRVWSREEMEHMVTICKATGTLLLSDEIHADITFDSHSFTGAIAFQNQYTNIMMFGSPGKTFGIPGIADAFLYAPDPKLQSKMQQQVSRFYLSSNNVFTNVATETGYSKEAAWLDDMLAYVGGSISFVSDFIEEKMPLIRFCKPQGTYQLWLDFRPLGLDIHALRGFLVEAGIGLNAGYGYGREGAGFSRMNVACPRVMIEKALSQLHVNYVRKFGG